MDQLKNDMVEYIQRNSTEDIRNLILYDTLLNYPSPDGFEKLLRKDATLDALTLFLLHRSWLASIVLKDPPPPDDEELLVPDPEPQPIIAPPLPPARTKTKASKRSREISVKSSKKNRTRFDEQLTLLQNVCDKIRKQRKYARKAPPKTRRAILEDAIGLLSILATS